MPSYGSNPQDLEPRPCIICGSKFQPYRDYQWTCSRSCRTRAKREQRAEAQAFWADLRDFTCQACGAEFQKSYSSGAKPRWCDTCRPEGERASQKRKNVARRLETATDPEYRRGVNLQYALRKYGITPDEYRAIFAAQDGRCAICGEQATGGIKAAARLHVDHDHVTGSNRKLLCGRCNQGVGFFRDDPKLLRLAAEYIERHREKVLADGTP